MWIPRKVFEDLIHDRSRAQGQTQVLEHQNVALQSMTDWLRVRLTQLEHERAQLIYNYMGVRLVVPNIEPAIAPIAANDVLNAVPSFEDMGDAAAAQQGINWNEHGEVVYTGSR